MLVQGKLLQDVGNGWEMAHRNAIAVLLSNALGLCLSLLEWVLVLELGTHGGCV